MKQSIAFPSVFLFFAIVLATHSSAVQSGGHQLQPWSKTCNMGSVGGDGCTVSVTMTASSNGTCPDGASEYCVSVSVSCPGSGSDPAEDCNSGPNCDVCAAGGSSVAVNCGGGCFSAQPRNTSNWDGVADDCGNLTARDSAHPCN